VNVKERQRTSKFAAFNFDDTEELIGFSKFDDVDDGGILGHEDEEDKTMNNRVLPKRVALFV